MQVKMNSLPRAGSGVQAAPEGCNASIFSCQRLNLRILSRWIRIFLSLFLTPYGRIIMFAYPTYDLDCIGIIIDQPSTKNMLFDIFKYVTDIPLCFHQLHGISLTFQQKYFRIGSRSLHTPSFSINTFYSINIGRNLINFKFPIMQWISLFIHNKLLWCDFTDNAAIKKDFLLNRSSILGA